MSSPQTRMNDPNITGRFRSLKTTASNRKSVMSRPTLSYGREAFRLLSLRPFLTERA